MKLSVVIPTHNRADTLKACLTRVMAQKGANFEVIVVDDGSTDNTAQVAAGFDCKYIKQSASQQGVARNRGGKEATGDVLVFIGDDIFPEPDFLRTHAEAHKTHPGENAVVLGFSTWDPTLEINHYMRFLESSGWQFGYGFLKPGLITLRAPYKFFYTSNLSIKKSFFEKEKFDESFRGYGWEDIELGYRLFKNQSMKMFYEPQAKALHHHHVPESELPKKMRAVGQNAIYFQNLHPEVRIVPGFFKALFFRLLLNPVVVGFSRIHGKRFHYWARSWKEFLKGMMDTKNNTRR